MAKPREIMGDSVPLSGCDVPWYGTADPGIAKDRAQETTAEVPVWVNGLQRWVTGIDRKTTCEDVIKVLLGSEPGKRHHHPGLNGHRAPEDVHHKYAIVERWRKVERPLDGRSKILKVWSAWGDAQRDVKLALRRRVQGTASGCSGTLSSGKEAARRRRHHHHHHDIGGEMSAKTIHPKRFHSRRDDDDERYHYDKEATTRTESPEREAYEYSGAEPKFTDTMEKLMKLILAQGETIQAQLKKLREREDQIDHFEHEVHRLRVKNHGSNYLLDTYLKGVDAEGGVGEEEGEVEECEEESKGEDSGVVTGGDSTDCRGDPLCPSESLSKQVARAVETSYNDADNTGIQQGSCPEGFKSRLESEPDKSPSSFADSSKASKDIQAHIELWEKIMRVNKKLEKTEECLVKLHVKLRQHPKEISPPIEALSREEEEILEKELEWTRAELEKVAMHSNGVNKELEKNDEALAHADEWLGVRHRVLEGLQLELDVAERESEVLLRKKEEMATVVHAASTLYGHQPPAPLPAMCHQKLPVREEGVGVVVTTPSANPIKKMMDKDSHDTDSNSDTGLSSLHSSSEEGGYVLDTLV